MPIRRQPAGVQTVRDAHCDLPDPERSLGKVQAHRFQPGACTYIGHIGRPLDEPAATLKAGYNGAPGGENMLPRTDGSVPYFTVRKLARTQTPLVGAHASGRRRRAGAASAGRRRERMQAAQKVGCRAV